MNLHASLPLPTELGSFVHPCEGDLVCKSTNEKVPYFNAPIFLENRAQIGKVDEIFGPVQSYVSFSLLSILCTIIRAVYMYHLLPLWYLCRGQIGNGYPVAK